MTASRCVCGDRGRIRLGIPEKGRFVRVCDECYFGLVEPFARSFSTRQDGTLRADARLAKLEREALR